MKLNFYFSSESTTDPEAGNDQTEDSDGPVNLIVQEPEIIIETEGTSEINIQQISLPNVH